MSKRRMAMVAALTLSLTALAEVLPPLPDGAFTYAVIPDTQLYHGEGTYVKKGQPKPTDPTTNPAFESRVNWIVDHLASERIFFVSHVGDIVDFKSPQQWSLASNIMARLDGKVPYGISPGNHDISCDDSRQFNAYFPRSRYERNSWYVGGFDGCLDEKGRRTVCAGNSDSCQLAEAGGVKFVFLHLECNAPEPVLKWVDQMLEKYADRKAIICTHMCVGYKTKAISDRQGKLKENPRPDEWFGVMDWSKCHGKNGLSGEQMWERCFSRHKNVILVVSGDQSAAISARETRKGVHGNIVHLTLQDYPRRNDDDDWIRLYRFRRDMSAIDVLTYSPRQKIVCERAQHKIGREHHVFTLPLDVSHDGAGVAVGENLLSNHIFESDQRPEPAFWNLLSKGVDYSWEAGGGPGALPAIRFASATGGVFSIRQSGLRLCESGRYRISCRIKATGFRAKGAGLHLAETGWRHPVGLKFDPGTYDWRRVEKTVEIGRPSKDGTWFAAVFAEKFTGEICVTDVAVTPDDEDTGSRTRFSQSTEIRESPRLVPMKPILSLIPDDDRKVFFSFFGRLRKGSLSDYEVRLSANGETVAAPLGREMFPVELPKGARGGRFTAAVVRKADGESLFSREYPYRVVAMPQEVSQGRRLNNLVVELFARELAAGQDVVIPVAFRKRMWLHLSAKARRVLLDGAECVGLLTPPHETFLEVDAGSHRISVEGASGGKIVLRSIPEVLDYQTSDGGFQRRRVFPSTTTLNGGRVAKSMHKWFRDTGHIHIGNVGMTDFSSAEDLRKRLDGCPGLSDPGYDGVACDELNPWSARKMSDFAEVLWDYRPPEGKRIYAWVVGKPFFKATDHDALSAALNACGGRGRFMNEFYCRTRETEEEARESVRGWLSGNLRAWGRLSPVLKNGYAPIFGAYTEMRYGSSMAQHCEVDYRYHLDLQFNILVNDPEFADIPCTGVWGTNYSDAELKDWTFRLFRHYCVEGRRTMLSDEFGLRYRPGHMRNCDFARGLDGWTASGDVRAAKVDGFGYESELRGGKNLRPIGDTFAELGTGAVISQKATGLTAGKRYLLEFMTFAPDDAHAHRKVDRVRQADVTIKGGRVDKGGESARIRHRPRAKTGATVTDNRVEFTADASEAEISFAARNGESLGINAISLRISLIGKAEQKK